MSDWDSLVFDRCSDLLSAGFPSAAEGYEDEPLDLHAWVVRNPAATFFFRARGDELCHEHIRDGSILVVDRSVRPSAGRLVVVEDGGEFAVVRFRAGVPATVCGVVTAVLTKL
jgi:DNA polymerase V